MVARGTSAWNGSWSSPAGAEAGRAGDAPGAKQAGIGATQSSIDDQLVAPNPRRGLDVANAVRDAPTR